METLLVIRPTPWLLFGAIIALIVTPIALWFLPNPFADLAVSERPSRFLLTMWLLLPVLIFAAVWRLLSWTTHRVTREGIEARAMLGAKRFAWTELTASELDMPIGMPPAYELRFGKRKVRFIARHHDRKHMQALKALLARAHQPLPPSANSAA